MAWQQLAMQAGLMLGNAYLDHRAQKKAFEQNKQFWHERFDKEAQYNSPVQQKARMMAAGLSPALMYKGGQTGGNISSPNAQGKIAERYAITELAKMSAEVGEINSRTRLNNAEVNLKGKRGKLFDVQTANATLDGTMKQILKGEYSEQQKQVTAKLTAEAKEVTARRQKVEAETENVEKQNKIMQKELDLYKKVYENYMQLGMNPDSPAAQQVLQFIVNLFSKIGQDEKEPIFIKKQEQF